jgi:hypothetical protein
MTQKPGGGGIKGGDVVRALIDLVILALLVCGAAFGGYWYGIHERLAPVQAVAPGTPGALPPTAVLPIPGQPAATTTATSKTATPAASTTTTTTAAAPVATSNPRHNKFWITSSGADKIGYVVTVKVNDTAVDNFFAPGKTIDITRLIRHGENEITFEAKKTEGYQKHAGDKNKQLIIQLVSGPKVQEEFKPSDVLATYKRNAAETEEEYTDTKTFSDGE